MTVGEAEVQRVKVKHAVLEAEVRAQVVHGSRAPFHAGAAKSELGVVLLQRRKPQHAVRQHPPRGWAPTHTREGDRCALRWALGRKPDECAQVLGVESGRSQIRGRQATRAGGVDPKVALEIALTERSFSPSLTVCRCSVAARRTRPVRYRSTYCSAWREPFAARGERMLAPASRQRRPPRSTPRATPTTAAIPIACQGLSRTYLSAFLAAMMLASLALSCAS